MEQNPLDNPLSFVSYSLAQDHDFASDRDTSRGPSSVTKLAVMGAFGGLVTVVMLVFVCGLL